MCTSADDCAQIAVRGRRYLRAPIWTFLKNGKKQPKNRPKLSTLIRSLFGGVPGRFGGPWLDSQVATLSSKASRVDKTMSATCPLTRTLIDLDRLKKHLQRTLPSFFAISQNALSWARHFAQDFPDVFWVFC